MQEEPIIVEEKKPSTPNGSNDNNNPLPPLKATAQITYAAIIHCADDTYVIKPIKQKIKVNIVLFSWFSSNTNWVSFMRFMGWKVLIRMEERNVLFAWQNQEIPLYYHADICAYAIRVLKYSGINRISVQFADQVSTRCLFEVVGNAAKLKRKSSLI